MAEWLTVTAALAEDSGLVPSVAPMLGTSQLPVTQLQGDPASLASMYTCTHMHIPHTDS